MNTSSPSIEDVRKRIKQLGPLVLLSIAGIVAAAVTMYFGTNPLPSITVGTVSIMGLAVTSTMLAQAHSTQMRHKEISSRLNDLEREDDVRSLREWIRELEGAANEPPVVFEIQRRLPTLKKRIEVLEDRNTQLMRRSRMEGHFDKMRQDVDISIEAARSSHRDIAACEAATTQLSRAKARREQLEKDVDALLAGGSWWQKLNFDYPDYRKLDAGIRNLEFQVSALLKKKGASIEQAEQHFRTLASRARSRLNASRKTGLSAIPASRGAPCDEKAIAQNALLLGALSVPVSAWKDVSQAGAVYDALREVNSGFANMSDVEIWLHTLTLAPESLAGLAALTKGALFESHVATSTGGALHDHFNTPYTDIVIDGVAFQIKATDSEAYIASVDTEIPVISTSEVAETTGAIDGGLTNAELDTAVELALGGSVLDVGDTVADATLAGLGGLGILASLRGINHAIDKHRAGMNMEEAIGEGVGIAVTGSLKASVDLAEMGYKVVTSRPSRFAGRQIVKALCAIGRAIDTGEHEGTRVDHARNGNK